VNQRKNGEDGPVAKVLGTAIGLIIGILIAAYLYQHLDWNTGPAEENGVREAIQGTVQGTPKGTHHGTIVNEEYPRARIELSLANGRGAATVLTFDVDTGFTGELCAPQEVIENELGLSPTGSRVYSMSDGWKTQVPVYRTRVMWHGEARWVTICSGTTQKLLGMGMLEHSVLTVDGKAGTVTVSPARSR
jgi:predicted aspartyl protease